MYILWKLVFLVAISTGPSRGSDLENVDDLNKEKSKQRTFLSKYEIIAQSKFHCQHKPSGYYADPQFDCKVFHYCQEDGTKITIPCILNTEKHKICVFRDVVSNACENSEIYLALPEDLQVKSPKETTASTINNATEFKLSNVLPIPLSPENNHSTTPLSLDFNLRNTQSSIFNTKETDSIFEVINSVLREIRTEDHKNISIEPQDIKLNPASFRRGSRFQPSSIRRHDSSDVSPTKDSSKKGDTFLVEVYQKRNGKLTDENNHYYKKSKKLFFLPKPSIKTPVPNPRRRKKRTVVEPISASRPYAVIYAKVPDVTISEVPRTKENTPNERLDILEVPFAAARVPADVPTIPITIETRRKKKSKAKKKPKNIPHAIFLQENLPQESGNEQTSEQQNILFFAAEENPNINAQNNHETTAPINRQRPRQNTDQFHQLTAGSEPQQNNVLPNYQASLSNQGAIPFQIPNFPFQPTTFLTDSEFPQYYLPSEEVPNSENFPSFNLQDQFVLQQQQPRVPQHNTFIIPNDAASQSHMPTNSESQTRQRDNNVPHDIIQTQNNQPQNNAQDNHSYQRNRQNNNIPQSSRQQNNIAQVSRPESRPQNIRKPEISAPLQYYSQPDYSSQTFRQPENAPQSHRQSGNVRPQSITQPENALIHTTREQGNVQTQSLRQPENAYSQNIRQPEYISENKSPENGQPQTFRNTENIQPQAFRYTLGVQPQAVGQPEYIQPQPLGQLQNLYLQNLPTFPFGHDGLQQTIKQPQPEEQKLTQNSNLQNPHNNNENKNKNEETRRPQSSVQTYSGFDSPFFQQFSNFRSPTFNNPFRQNAPQTYDVISPNTIRYQELHNPSQHRNTGEKTREQIPQHTERPQDQNIRPVISERPPNYEYNTRQQNHNNRNSASNRPGASVQQPNSNLNVVDAGRIIQERPNPVHENTRAQSFVPAQEIPRPPRDRGRTTVVTASTTRPPTRQRSRTQQTPSSEHYSAGRPQENTRLPQRYQESSQYSSTPRRPTQSPRSTSEVVYHPQYEPETSGGRIINNVYNRHPTTVSITDLRSRQHQKPYNGRDDQTDTNPSQRQRSRQYYYDSNNRQTQPEYSTYHHLPTTPLPAYTPHERSRRPQSYQNRGIYEQNSRQINKESAATTEEDKPYYRYKTTLAPTRSRSRTRTSTTREQLEEKLPVTSMYFVTSTPRHRPTEGSSYSRRPYSYLETQHEKQRNRPKAQIEGPPHNYVKAEPIREEISLPHSYYSNQQPNSNYENDVNIISTADDPGVRQRTTPEGSERRPGYRGTSVNGRLRYNPDINQDSIPVSEKPPREYRYTTQLSENEYSQTPRTSDREYTYATNAPAREYVTRRPEKEYLYTPEAPDREYIYVPRNTERELSYSTQLPESEYSYSTQAPEREYAYVPRHTEREPSYSTSAPKRDYSYVHRNVEKELSYSTRAPQREYSRYSPEPEEPSYAPRTPNRHRERINPNTHENRYQNEDTYEDIPTTRSTTTTTTTRATKKPRPPPPRPTFPPFPTFPPPPRRTTTTPRPQTESPKYEKSHYETTEYVPEYSVATEKTTNNDKPKIEYKSEVSEPRYVTENYIQTSTPEVTTKRRSRKRRPRPRRPKTTTPYSEDEDSIQVESITQATTHNEVSTRSTPSNYNRWRQQASATKKTTTTTVPTTKSTTENSDKTEEYGSRINLFGRPRTRKPAFSPRPQTSTATPSYSNDRKRVTKSPIASRTRKPFVKKVKKKLTTTTETPDVTESIARSDENSDVLHFDQDINLQELESATQLLIENMEDYQTTEVYKDQIDTTTEVATINYENDELTDSKDKSENFESTRSLSNKFQNRPRILKFGKPRLKATDSPLDSNEKESR